MAETVTAVDNTDTYIAFIGTALMILIVLMFISLLIIIVTRFFG
jgi:hypothetical protein